MTLVEHESIAGVYWITEGGTKILATRNYDVGFRVYGERLFKVGGTEYREWVPYRSKLAAAIIRGLTTTSIREGSKVLYLGSSTGTTVSHVSDIVGGTGIIFAVDFAPRAMTHFLAKVANRRSNVLPILADARLTERYSHIVDMVDVVYCDVAQPDQSSILLANCRAFLRSGGEAMIAIKARSIDSTEDPQKVYAREIELLERNGLKPLESLNLEPYERDHIFVRLRYE